MWRNDDGMMLAATFCHARHAQARCAALRMKKHCSILLSSSADLPEHHLTCKSGSLLESACGTFLAMKEPSMSVCRRPTWSNVGRNKKFQFML